MEASNTNERAQINYYTFNIQGSHQRVEEWCSTTLLFSLFLWCGIKNATKPSKSLWSIDKHHSTLLFWGELWYQGLEDPGEIQTELLFHLYIYIHVCRLWLLCTDDVYHAFRLSLLFDYINWCRTTPITTPILSSWHVHNIIYIIYLSWSLHDQNITTLLQNLQ